MFGVPSGGAGNSGAGLGMVGSVISPSGARKPGGIVGSKVPSGSKVPMDSISHSINASTRRWYDAFTFMISSSLG